MKHCNGVSSCSDPSGLQAICDELSSKKIGALLRKWLSILPQPLTAIDRNAGCCYAISIRENLDLRRPGEVQLLLDRKIIQSTPGRLQVERRNVYNFERGEK